MTKWYYLDGPLFPEIGRNVRWAVREGAREILAARCRSSSGLQIGVLQGWQCCHQEGEDSGLLWTGGDKGCLHQAASVSPGNYRSASPDCMLDSPGRLDSPDA